VGLLRGEQQPAGARGRGGILSGAAPPVSLTVVPRVLGPAVSGRTVWRVAAGAGVSSRRKSRMVRGGSNNPLDQALLAPMTMTGGSLNRRTQKSERQVLRPMPLWRAPRKWRARA
jgi:hypothetical protein